MEIMKSRLLLACLFVLLLEACGGGGGRTATTSQPVSATNPTPSISNISPASAPRGSGAFTLTVDGANFIATSIVRWNGSDRTTALVSSTRLTAQITAADLATAGTATVTTFNPSPGGGTSNNTTFTISSVPVISTIKPPDTMVGVAPLITLTGLNFTANSVVRWNGSDRVTSFLNPGSVAAQVLSADVVGAGSATVTVADPNGTSNPVTFNILNRSPQLGSITPSAVVTGSGAFTLTVDGGGFITNSVVRLNNSDRPTTYVNSTRLTAAIPATDVATAASFSVTVFTPSPGGGLSGSATLVVAAANPVPTVTSISPSSVMTGTTANNQLTLTVDGTNFVPTSLARLNGSERTTFFVSATRLTVSLLPLDAELGGIKTLTVFNSPPQGGTSNGVAFTVQNPVPTVTSLSPPSAIAGDAPIMLTVSGVAFVPNTVVQWNGHDVPTQYDSNTSVTAAISSADLASAGSFPVRAINPAPNGGTSSALNFTLATRTTNPQPIVTALTENQAPAGWPGMALGMTGSGFVGSTTARFNGALRQTTVLSSTTLQASIPPQDLANVGTFSVTVENGSPGGGTSTPLNFAVVGVAPETVGVIQRISANTTDYQTANDYSFGGRLSSTGRYAVFYSYGDNLVANDLNRTSDTFLRDTCLGAAPGCVPANVRVSVNDQGIEGDGPSYDAGVSADGRYVAFASEATNLVSGTNSPISAVYLRDTCIGATGCTPATIRISPPSSTASYFGPFLSSNARFVAYGRIDLDAVTVFVADTCIGAPIGCTIGVVDSASGIVEFRLSGNGRYLVFSSRRTDLVPGSDGTQGIFVRDTCAGASSCTPSVLRVSEGLNGVPPNDYSFLPAIGADGRYVVFSSWASNLVANNQLNGHQVYLRDTCIGAGGGCSPETLRISIADNGTQARSGGPATGGATVSVDGRYVAFGSNVGLASGDTNSTFDIFVRDTCIGATGCTPTTKRVSVSLIGMQGNDRSDVPVMTDDGRYVIFQSAANTLAPGSGPYYELFVARTGKP
jgi:trimeric autotransporter adhesin